MSGEKVCCTSTGRKLRVDPVCWVCRAQAQQGSPSYTWTASAYGGVQACKGTELLVQGVQAALVQRAWQLGLVAVPCISWPWLSCAYEGVDTASPAPGPRARLGSWLAPGARLGTSETAPARS